MWITQLSAEMAIAITDRYMQVAAFLMIATKVTYVQITVILTGQVLSTERSYSAGCPLMYNIPRVQASNRFVL